MVSWFPCVGELADDEQAASVQAGRVRRRPRRQEQQRQPGFVVPMLMISDRPAGAADRSVPGHWEGDLIIGKDSASQIGTLVERQPLPPARPPARRPRRRDRPRRPRPDHGHPPAAAQTVADLGPGPRDAARPPVRRHRRDARLLLRPALALAARQQREHNGLLRRYFPKGTDLSACTHARLDAVAAELNARPRKTLGWETPAERLANS
jgi:transposase, IS30 family